MTTFDRVRLMWPDHLGIPRGKYLPGHLVHKGTGHCVTTFALGYDRSMIPAPGSFLLEGLRDVIASCEQDAIRQGWEGPGTGVAVAHLDFEGEPYTFSGRYALQKAIADWAELGYTVKVGIELEAYVIEPDGDGGWKPWDTPRSFVYGTGRLADPSGLIDDIMSMAAACEFRIESVNAEFDAGQFEFTLEYDDALQAIDDIFLFRIMAREMALERGLDLTFMGKPFPVVSGSGMHVNFSLSDAAGNNAMADESAVDDHGISALAKQCLAGLVEHHQALVALVAPTVNAYRRLRPGELAGYWANWGHDHRMAANRVPETRGAGTRIENRVPDGSASPYLATAAVLQAARLGVVDELACPDPLTEDGLETSNTETAAAATLAQALEHLAADEAFISAVGDDVIANFQANKEAEWERYTAAEGDVSATDIPEDDSPSAWEISEYLPYH